MTEEKVRQIQTRVVALWAALAITNILLIATLVYQGRVQKEVTAAYLDEADLVWAGTQLEEASRLLAESARAFAVTNSPRYLQHYWEEVDGTQQREEALAELNRRSASPEEAALLKEAKLRSDELIEVEIQSMKLVLEAYNVADEATHPSIAAFQLTPEEQALSSEEKLRRAQAILYDENYREGRRKVNDPIEKYQEILDARVNRETEAAEHKQKIVRLVALALSIILLVLLTLLVWMRLLSVRHTMANGPSEPSEPDA